MNLNRNDTRKMGEISVNTSIFNEIVINEVKCIS